MLRLPPRATNRPSWHLGGSSSQGRRLKLLANQETTAVAACEFGSRRLKQYIQMDMIWCEVDTLPGRLAQATSRVIRRRASRRRLSARLQRGEQPDDFKPMPSIGQGVEEIRIWDEAGTFRVIYTARIGDTVVVLHAFQKKTQTTGKRDIDLARARWLQLKEQ